MLWVVEPLSLPCPPPGPYVGKFSHKIKIRSKDDSDSDLVSIEEVQEDVPVH
jgi:hypothetical protein